MQCKLKKIKFIFFLLCFACNIYKMLDLDNSLPQSEITLGAAVTCGSITSRETEVDTLIKCFLE